MGTDEIITTDVDSLIKLLENRPEIALNEVSKTLNVAESIVESWACFLEEEGILKFKYKFTKPFLVYQGTVNKPAVKKSKFMGFLTNDKEKSTNENDPLNIPDEIKPEHSIRIDKSPNLPAPEPIKKQKKLSKITDKIQLALEHMHKGKFDEAKEIYSAIKSSYDSLPKRFESEKEKLADQLTDLGKQLAINIDSFREHELKDSSNLINLKINEIRNLANNNEFPSADKLLKELKIIYLKLPKGFLEFKSRIHDQLLNVNNEIFTKKLKYYQNQLQSGFNKIENLIKTINRELEQENIDKAESIFNEILDIKNSLPPGSMNQKIKLNQELLELHEDILETKYGIIALQTTAKCDTISTLLTDAYKNLKNTQIESAEQIYNDAREIFDTLPNESIADVSKLNNELNRFDELLMRLKIKSSTTDFNVKQKKILNLINLCKKYIKRESVDLAAAIYNEVLQSYNELPEGFLDEKTKIKNELLELYKRSVLTSDRLFLSSTNQEMGNKYHDLITLLMNAHKNIRNREFQSMLKDTDYVNKIYEQLPVGFVKKNLKIVKEIIKLNLEAEIFRAAQFITKLNKSDHGKILPLLKKIYADYDKLIKQCPEDKELFAEIKKMVAPVTIDLMKKNKHRNFRKNEIITHAKAIHNQTIKDNKKALDIRNARVSEANKRKEIKKDLILRDQKLKKELEVDIQNAGKFDDHINFERNKLIDENNKIKLLHTESQDIKNLNLKIANERAEAIKLSQAEDNRRENEEILRLHLKQLKDQTEARKRQISEEKRRKLEVLDELQEAKKIRKKKLMELEKLHRKHQDELEKRNKQLNEIEKIKMEHEKLKQDIIEINSPIIVKDQLGFNSEDQDIATKLNIKSLSKSLRNPKILIDKPSNVTKPVSKIVSIQKMGAVSKLEIHPSKNAAKPSELSTPNKPVKSKWELRQDEIELKLSLLDEGRIK